MFTSSRARRVRALSGLAVLAAGAIALSACASGGGNPGDTSSGEVTTVRAITLTMSGATWPLFIAEEKGYFAEEGLDVELTSVSPAVSVNAIISGSADIGLIDAYSVVPAVDKGAPVTMVGQGLDNSPYYLLAAKDITKVSQLAGKVIGVYSELDPYNVVLNEILKKNGVDPSTVDFVYGQGSSDRLAALEGGAIQATLLPPPTSGKAMAEGLNSLAETRDYLPVMTVSTIGANTNWAKAHPDAVKGFVAALGKAVTWLYDPANEDSALRILQDEVGGDIKNAEEAYDDFVTTKVWDESGCVQSDALSSLLQRLDTLGVTDSTDPGKYSTTEYCS